MDSQSEVETDSSISSQLIRPIVRRTRNRRINPVVGFYSGERLVGIQQVLYVCFVIFSICGFPCVISEIKDGFIQPRGSSSFDIQHVWSQLSPEELTAIFGRDHHEIKVPNIDIVIPTVKRNQVLRKRSLSSKTAAKDEKIEIQLTGLGRQFNFTLHENRNLLDPHFVHLLRGTNESSILTDDHVRRHIHCFYHGTAHHVQMNGDWSTNGIMTGSVALNVCDGFEGLVVTNPAAAVKSGSNLHYFLYPLPTRLSVSNGVTTTAHFMWSKPVDSLTPKQLLSRRKRDSTSYQFSEYNIFPQNPMPWIPMKFSRRNNNNNNENRWTNKWRQQQDNSFSRSTIFPSHHWQEPVENPRTNLNTPTYGRVDPTWVKSDDLVKIHSIDQHVTSSYYKPSKTKDNSAKRSIHRRTMNEPNYVSYETENKSNYNRNRYNKNKTRRFHNNRNSRRGRNDRKIFHRNNNNNDDQNHQLLSDSSENLLESTIRWNKANSVERSLVTKKIFKRRQSSSEEYFEGDENTLWYEHKRKKDEEKIAHLTIETAVFVDKDLYAHMKANFPEDTQGEVSRIVLAMINAVQLLYNDPSLGHRVDFVLKRLEVLEEDPPGLLRPYDIDRFLTNFCKWQKTQNPSSDKDPLHWDHALILTGLDLYVVHESGKISNQVVGLAPVSGMCTKSSSCTVNEGRHFESVFVISHEIGHNLGMRHDGAQADNWCDPSGHIMSPTLGSGKITWSSCSRKYLDLFLETRQAKCLFDKAEADFSLKHQADGRLPGERFDADKQCVLKYGRGSYHATQQPMEDVCRDLHCRREHFTWTSHPALEGTYCGVNKWCRSGKCYRKDDTISSIYKEAKGSIQFHRGDNHLTMGLTETAAYSSPKALDGGWGKWSPFTDCSSSCIQSENGDISVGSTGIRLAARRCDSPRPENGGRQCSGPDRRYKTCPHFKVCRESSIASVTTAQYADEVCSRASAVDTELTGRGYMTSANDAERACSVWCETRDIGGSRSRGWSFPDGTACKLTHLDSTSITYCVAGKCQEFSCDPQSHFELSSEECSFSTDSRNEKLQDSWLSRDIIVTEQDLRPNRNLISFHPNDDRKTTENNQWSDWESLSECKLSCLAPAKGFQLVNRFCKLGDGFCSGLSLSVRLCKPDKLTIKLNGCTRLQTPFEYATNVCTKYSYKVSGLSGIGMQLSPTSDDVNRPCRVGCQDSSIPYRFYMVNGEEGWFPPGTDCSRGEIDKKAFCLAGKCIEFGDDDTPLYHLSSKLTGTLDSVFHRSKRETHEKGINTRLNEHHKTMNEKDFRTLINQFYRNKEHMHNLPEVSINFSQPVDYYTNMEMESNLGQKDWRKRKYHVSLASLNFNNFVVDVEPKGSSKPVYLTENEANLKNVIHSDSQGRRNKINRVVSNQPAELVEGSFFEWRKIISDCSATCGFGTQNIVVECVSGSTVVADTFCPKAKRPGMSKTVPCYKRNCVSLERGDQV